MLGDAGDLPGVVNERDKFHPLTAFRTNERIDLVDFFNPNRPLF